jgi:hypothetical protein
VFRGANLRNAKSLKYMISFHVSSLINGPNGLRVFKSSLLNIACLLLEFEIAEYGDRMTRVPAQIDRHELHKIRSIFSKYDQEL